MIEAPARIWKRVSPAQRPRLQRAIFPNRLALEAGAADVSSP
jgi:hypothetical protein